jgi:ArsR family transcriptional regulator
MSDMDTTLNLLQNKVRRQILERLVREPHYPMQLADRIGVSQQAIMKHLKLLEESKFVVKMKVASSIGGPPKNIYSIQQAISLRIDLGPDLFTCEQRKLPRGGPMRLSNRLPKPTLGVAEAVSGRKRISLSEGMSHLGQITSALEEIDEQRDALIALHQVVKHKISSSVDSEFDSYEARAVVHNMLESPRSQLNLKALSQELRLGANATEEIMDTVRLQLLREIGEKAGHIFAAPEGTNLPWWAMLDMKRK